MNNFGTKIQYQGKVSKTWKTRFFAQNQGKLEYI